ncbi:hypothetical protein PBAL39_25515 [Pedobacter sp. BAL39]|uniref:GAF domain-containing protein n=1 Tax=Pedobacter sp. BAL39 TaxID=391596 RepID=UPI000155951D|nr:GAF domain-containing protein [Pedobacter sp. BAL39]EDM36689.1 hypothetical protein PBAL39_25515 [Pedobacter sp. BAL39]
MDLLSFYDTPFELKLSFEPIVTYLRARMENSANEDVEATRRLLTECERHPELMEGISDRRELTRHEGLIKRMLADYFPEVLTYNEIKAVTIPFTDIFFNYTERLKAIVEAAGTDFTLTIRDFDRDQFYIMNCCMILNEFYGTQLDFSKPLFYDIPTGNGIIKHYRMLYNGDFMEILPTDQSVPLTQEDIDLLLNNYDDLTLWKEKFPENSWQLKGFVIMTLYDATVESAASILKERLLGLNVSGFQDTIQSVFRSIFRIPDIRIGVTVFDSERRMLVRELFGHQMQSFLLPGEEERLPEEVLCGEATSNLLEESKYFSVSDVAEFKRTGNAGPLADRLLANGIHSFILAPVVKNKHLYGILEVVSLRAKELNSINAHKLEVVMPFLTESVERLRAELQNQVQAVIQDKFTAIHESVYWKFREEARQLILHQQIGKDYKLKEIVFPDVYPLYGQVDIKGSSEARNASVKHDLTVQIDMLVPLLQQIAGTDVPDVRMELQQLNLFKDVLELPMRASTEQQMTSYFAEHLHPLLEELASPELREMTEAYFLETDRLKGRFHEFRRKYELTISMVNDKMAEVIDGRQREVQALYPHYYERFKTDGIEHNVYMGQSIAPTIPFSISKLRELRLWQLLILCEMERAHHDLKPLLPYPLDVTTLVLVHYSTIDIRFRMDEKRFDVDGSYNARFEIVKKRIDKANIKDSDERITAAGKITIVYSNEEEEAEYLGYIEELQSRRLVASWVEKIELEDLQGVSGLKALRIALLHGQS